MNESTLCPRMEKASQILSKRWAVLIIYQLLSGRQRFCTIEAALPISGRLLSERLKDLEQEGIVLREVFPETPVRIEYSLTEKGRALEPVIRGIEAWSIDWVK
ncbi:helix-turn-helix domain-containing protein [Paenibacillus validus]|uniref:Transcriptional regulator n=1 Tax=Paenibacillus validus TaxID=44253 RepID=A0A7X2ZDP4_9BACL|nr:MULTISPECIES: helix-turn-helix domain-containing protein [Paenibacillus]MED4602615.1 helix-turn-helix domain-containing protein [Paenibacillus validus]MED4607897.1 helix-turn-helix domain-containing protein [Paenibacillus validus]MUG72966.1 transcriptional regulator [Paenibacillus validus]